MVDNDSPTTNTIDDKEPDAALPVPDSTNRRKHKKYRYRRTGHHARKILIVLGILAFWAALMAGWYYLVTLEKR
ncbi:MAG: hypothetical protein JWO20_2505 [Candidatus Angelobacter sp.]|jgi:hypothetical protein|nr:hypothetical protein [Candidatus Angelobacter sp.]